MKLLLSLLLAVFSLASVAQTKTTKAPVKAPVKKKPALPLIGPGTILTYSLGSAEDENEEGACKATLVVRIKTVSPGLQYDYMIIEDDPERPRHGRESNSAAQLKSIDTIAGFDDIASLSPPWHYNYQSLFISTNAYKTLQAEKVVNFGLGANDNIRMKKNDENWEFEVNLHSDLYERDTAYTGETWYVHGKKLYLKSLSLEEDGKEDDDTAMEIWNNPKCPLILYYYLPGLGTLRLTGIM
jgi:hypothetical protein